VPARTNHQNCHRMENSSTMKDVEDETEMALTDTEDCGAATDYVSLDRHIQAQRVVALEERRLDAAI
jgi:hypothetical protein